MVYMKKRRVRLSSNVIKIISIVAICFSIYLLIGVGQEIFSMIQLQNKAKVAEEELNKLKDENAELIAQKSKLEDPNYVQSYARGNYMFSKEGEQIFYLPSSNSTKEEAE